MPGSHPADSDCGRRLVRCLGSARLCPGSAGAAPLVSRGVSGSPWLSAGNGRCAHLLPRGGWAMRTALVYHEEMTAARLLWDE